MNGICRRLMAGLAVIAATACAADKQKVTVYGEAHYPPYTFEEDGVFKGIYVEIYRRAFERMENYQVELKAVPWSRGLHLLEQGKAFAMFPPYLNIKRRPFIHPYSVPVLKEKVVLVCRSELLDGQRQQWPEDFYGLRIAINSGYLTGGQVFLDAVDAGRFVMFESIDTNKNLLMVAKGRVDCYINNELAIRQALKRLSEFDAYTQALSDIRFGPVTSIEYSYLAYSNVKEERYPYKQDFVQTFDAVMAEMQRSGEIEALISQYLESN